jgi:hypothetical protein
LLRVRFDRRQATATRTHDREMQEARPAHEREAEWRQRLVFAAEDFSIGVEQAILSVRDVISAVSGRDDVESAVKEAKRRLHEVVARFARIKLLFGERATATAPAVDLLVELDLARNAAAKADATFAWEKLEKVYMLHTDFNSAAFEMISSPRWAVGRSLEMPYSSEHPAAQQQEAT